MDILHFRMLINPCNAEAHETEDSSVPHDKIIDCVTSCVLLARLSDILKWQKDLGHVYSNSLSPGIPWIGMHQLLYYVSFFPSSSFIWYLKLLSTVKVSVFTSIKELCSKINEGLKDSDQSAHHADISSLVVEVTQLHNRPYYPS